MRRQLTLPEHGVLLVSTDVHGSRADFEQMVARYEASAAASDTHWVILGDIVHGPDELARARRPDLYDYDDESPAIARRILELQAARPGRVHFVLGNHDWAHVGGPTTSKFYRDEAQQLESTLVADELADLRALFRGALLFVVAPCGAFLSHASPGNAPASLAEVDDVDLSGSPTERDAEIIRSFTNFYGQEEARSRAFLAAMSALSSCELTFVVHGHDRDEAGWFVQEKTQICPVIFGAPRPAKRYLRLELSARYNGVHDLREGHEILRLWTDD